MRLLLTAALRHFLGSLASEAARQAVLDSVLREAESIRALTPGPERARVVHQRVEAARAPFAALKPAALAAVRCGRGCCHCCRIRVDLTWDEALLLAERVRSGSAHPDLGRLERQRSWAEPGDFIGRPRHEADCVFLGPDGECTVYADRPSACRALLVASDPEHCREAGAGSQVLAVINPYVERVVSAARTVDAAEGHGHWLASGLAAALAQG